MAYYSSQASIEARISALRLNGYIDRNADGFPDDEALESGQKEARGLIRGYLKRAYESTVIDAWDIDDDTVPDLINAISDQLCIRVFYSSNPRFQESANQAYREAIAQLEMIRDGKIDLYEADRATSYIADALDTGRIDSDFDPEREYNDLTVKPSWVTPPDGRELENY